MPELTFPPLTRAIRWTADGDWYTGAVEMADEHGVVATVEGRVSKAAVVAIARDLRQQLAQQAPAEVDVGQWGELQGLPQQDLHRWVMGQELTRSIADQVERRGWVHRPPWFEAWTADTMARAYRLILGAQARDEYAVAQLDRIRTGALADNPACVEALAKFNALGRLVARGMTLEAIFAAAHLGAPDTDEWVVEAGAMQRASSAQRSVPRAPVRTSAQPAGRRPASRRPVGPLAVARPTGTGLPLGRITPIRMAVPIAVPVASPYPYPQAPPYPYGYPPPGGGGGGGGEGDYYPDEGGGSGGLDDDGGDFDSLNDPIPPPEDGTGGDDEGFPEPPPDDGSGHAPFAAAPGEGGGAEAGGAAPDGTVEVTAHSVGGGGGPVEMVADLGSDDVYPDEGALMGSK